MKRPIDLIVIHCSDSPDNADFRAHDIHEWHQGNEWDGIGYHYVICRDGQSEAGRPEYWAGAHVKNYNSTSIGICLIGRNTFTPPQMNTLRMTLIGLMTKYPEVEIRGHYELDTKKTCPNFDVPAQLAEWGLLV